MSLVHFYHVMAFKTLQLMFHFSYIPKDHILFIFWYTSRFNHYREQHQNQCRIHYTIIGKILLERAWRFKLFPQGNSNQNWFEAVSEPNRIHSRSSWEIWNGGMQNHPQRLWPLQLSFDFMMGHNQPRQLHTDILLGRSNICH